MSFNYDTDDEYLNARDYWLGRIESDDLDVFEERWFGSEDAAEYLSAIRDDLIDEYLNGEMNIADESSFQTHFLESPAHVQMLAVAGATRDARLAELDLAETEKAKPSVIESFIAGLRSLGWRPALGIGFAVLLLTMGVVVFMRLERGTKEIASVPDPTPSPEERLAEVSPPTLQPNSNQRTPEQRPPSKPPTRLVALALTPIGRDGQNEMPVANVPTDVATVRLSIPTPGITQNFDSYSAKLAGSNGRTVFTKKLQDLSLVVRDSLLSVDVPARGLNPGTYTFSIVGSKAGQADEVLSRSQFRIRD